jgi:hypothetical protein
VVAISHDVLATDPCLKNGFMPQKLTKMFIIPPTSLKYIINKSNNNK